MRTFLLSMVLFIIALAVIPVGGMSSSNPYAEMYMYGFLACEIFVLIAIIRVYILTLKNK
jgi:hypothetical protein